MRISGLANARRRRAVLLAAASLAALSSVPAKAVVFQGLGVLPGSTISFATATSADGTVVSGSSGHAFLWTSGGGLADLGTLGGTGSTASDLSANGTVVVGDSLLVGDVNFHAFRWTSGSGLVDLGTLSGGTSSNALGVSADGSVVVGLSNVPGSVAHAFRWTGGGMVDLGTFGGNISIANGVSADGSVVVGASDLAGNLVRRAFRWTSGTGLVDIGTLGGDQTSALAVSGDGLVVVGEGNTGAGLPVHAFRWTGGTGMVDLGTLGGTESRAHGANSDGSVVVGQSRLSDGVTFRAFRWNAATGMQSIQDMLTANGVDLTGWNLSGANELSGDGTIIVGFGVPSPTHAEEAWIATIPLNAFALLDLHGANLALSSLLWGGIVTNSGPGAATLTAGSDNTSTTFIGHFQDGAAATATGFTKVGTGTLTMTGVSTNTGATNINAGTLILTGALASSPTFLNGGATLKGTGTVGALTVTNGILSPGTGGLGSIGTLSANGATTLGANSNFLIDTGTAGTDKLAVTGALGVGGTATFNFTGTPHFGDSAVIATATTISGSFASIPDPISGSLFPKVTIVTVGGGQQLVMTVASSSYLAGLAGPDADQTAIANALDADQLTHYNDMKPLFDALNPLGSAALGTALTHLAPDSTRTMPMMATLETDAFSTLIRNHLADLGTTPPDQMAFRADPDALHLVAASGVTPGAAAIPAAPRPAEGGWTGFGDDIGGFFSASAIDGSVATSPAGGKADVDGYLIALGLDARASDHLVLGAAFAFARNRAVLIAAPSTTSANSLQAMIYGRYTSGGWFAEGFAGASSQRMTSDRTVVTGPTTFNLHGETEGTSPTVALSGGYGFGGEHFRVTPALGLQWLEASVDGYTETGGAPAMTFADFSRHSFAARYGFDASADWRIGTTLLTPSLHLFGVHDFLDGPGAITAAFAAAPAALMSFSLAPKTSDWLEAGAGLAAQVDDNMSLGVRYDTTSGRSDITAGAWTAQMRVRF